jgi:hypothetical protein
MINDVSTALSEVIVILTIFKFYKKLCFRKYNDHVVYFRVSYFLQLDFEIEVDFIFYLDK